MARTLDQIQQSIIAAVAASQELSPLQALTVTELEQLQPDSTSRVAQWRKLVHAMALSQHDLEVLMEAAFARMELLIASQRVATVAWWQETILRFQFGAVADGNGNYNNSALTVAQVDAMKVFKYAAVTRTVESTNIIMRGKVAKLAGDVLVAVSAAELAAGQAFVNANTPAGSITRLTTGSGDLIKLVIEIHFDPQVLDSDGKRLDGTGDSPVEDATRAFLQRIEFNDSYVRAYHTDALQRVPGVKIPVIREAASKYALHDYTTTTVANAGVIDQIRVADSGYFIIDNAEFIITYLPYE